MEKTFEKVEELVVHVKEYMNNRINTVKLNTAEKGSKLMANMITMAVSILIFGLFVLFISLALAFVIGKAIGELYWGFLIVSGFYLILGILVFVFREKLLRLPILNALLKQLFKGEDEEDQ